MRTTIGAGGKKYGPIGHLRRHSTPWEVPGDACGVRWSGVAINATNRVHQCVFSPLSYWIYGGAAGDEYIWLLPTSAAMLDHPTRRAPPHRSCGRQWRTGRASWPYFFPPAPVVVRTYFVWEVRPYWSAFGLSHTNCMGFHHTFKYCKTFVLFQKLTGGGDSTLIRTQPCQKWDFI